MGKGSTVGKLTSTKGPQCSEMTSRVQGCVKSVEEQHRKQVELMFRDRNAVLNRVNKSQAQVYRTMLRVHKEKKILERDQHRRQLETTASMTSEPKHARDSAKASSYYSSTYSPSEQQDDSSGSESGDSIQEPSTREIGGVPQQDGSTRHTHNLPHLNRDGTKTEIDVKWYNKPPSKLHSITLPEIAETNGLCGKAAPHERLEESTHLAPSKEAIPAKVKDTMSTEAESGDRRTWPVPWLPAATDRSSPSQHHSSERHCSQPAGSTHNPQAGLQQPSLGSRRLSYMELARMKTSELQMKRKEQLNKEPVVDYVMGDDGNIVSADNTQQYQRPIFPTPSLRQRHQQQKLLQTELSAAVQHKEKAEMFFERLAIENAESAAAARHRRHLAKMAAIKAGRSTEVREKSGITLADLVAVFQQSDKLAKGVDPNSMEAMKICKYVRKFRPLMMSKEDRQRAKVNKLSSWHYTK